jgi:hypothetical protein
VSRERWLLAAATLVISALIASIFVAQVQARRAEYRFEQVRRLANTSLFDFDDRVRALPGSEEARRLVVRNTLDYLQSVDTGAGVDPSLEWELASVYEKLARIQSELGDTLGARRSYRRALELVRSYSASHADDRDARKKLESLGRLASDAPQ